VKFASPLRPGTLLRRYKRFFADVRLEDGTTVTAHCPNTGRMLGVSSEGARVWLSVSDNPKRRLAHTWELMEDTSLGATTLVGINPMQPNRLAEEAIRAGIIGELRYEGLRREVRYGRQSRVDLLLEEDGRPPCYVEVKNVHLRREPRLAEFPDSVTDRGARHLDELAEAVLGGARAVMFYLVQRSDCDRFAVAADIDPAYAAALERATAAGVEVICYGCALSPAEIAVNRALSWVGAKPARTVHNESEPAGDEPRRAKKRR